MAQRKVVAITGASSGIGAATARMLADRGMRVVLGSRGESDLRAVADDITGRGGEAVALSVDVRKREDVQRLVDFAQEKFGRLDVLISNAGAMANSPLDDLAVDDWELMVDVNLKGVLYGIAAALPVFRRQKSGHFINVASTSARKFLPHQAVYAATKAGVAALSDVLRQEVAGELRVTVVFPGFTATNYLAHVKNAESKAELEERGKKYAMDADRVAAAIAYAMEQPDDVNVGEIVIRSLAQP